MNIYAIDCDDYSIEEYVNSDSLLNSDTYSIKDYPEIINSRGGIRNHGTGYYWENIGMDDYIVDIIPKSLFSIEGNQFCIGDEYGFFINTVKEVVCNAPYASLYNSTVMVFDIDVNVDLIETNNNIVFTVEPLFEYNYLCLNGNAKYSYCSFDFDYSLEEPWIILNPVYTDYSNNEFKCLMSSEYYLKDISIGACLLNENSLNYGDEGYNPLDDNGCFFTGFDYSLDASYLRTKNVDWYELIQNGADNIRWGFGWLDTIPGIGSVTATLGQIYDFANLTKNNTICLKNFVNDYLKNDLIPYNKGLTASYFYPNKMEQLTYYKDTIGNPFLVKKAGIEINTAGENSLLFGVNDCLKTYFTVNYTTSDNECEFTRLINHLVLKISKIDGETIETSGRIVTNYFGEKNKTILTYNSEKIYLLPNGFNMFKFVPEYAGYYDIKVSISGDVKIKINDEFLSINKSLEITKYFKLNEEVIIKIYGNAQSQRGTIQIDNSNQLNDIEIESECEYVLSLNGISGVNWIYTNNDNIVITKLKYYDNNNSIVYYSFNFLESKITIPLKSENKYYVYIKNKSNVKLETSISIDPVRQIYCDSPNQVVLTSNITYYKVVNDNGGQYIFSFFNDYSNEYLCTLLDSNLEVIPNLKKEDRGIYNISLDENKVYYIGITNYKNTNAKIVFKKADNAYSWLIKSNGDTVYDGFDDLIYLERGNSYIVRLKINGEVTNLRYSSEDLNNAPNYNLEVSSDGKLTIPLSTPLGGNGLRIEAENSYGEYFSNKIYIIPTINLNRITMTTYNDDDFGFGLNIPREIKGINYIIDNKIKCEINNINLDSRNTIYQSIKDDYLKCASLNISNIQIKVYELKYIDIYNRVQIKGCDLSCALENNFFYSGNGTNEKPYLINCLRHFENLRKLNDNKLYFKLSNNIICEKNWEPLPEFNGFFDGNNYSINGIKMEISSSCTEDSFGLFTKNYGTIKNLIINESGTHTQNQKGFNPNKYIYSGMFCGQNYGSIENCKYKSNNINMCFFVPAVYVGGIAGYNSGTISKCYVYSHNVDGYGNKGGICGINTINGKVIDCIFDGLITNRYEKDDQLEQYSVGGFVGINYGEVEYCKNYGKIKFSLGNYPETKLSDSRTMQPRMGLYIGTNYGTYKGNVSYIDIDTKGLKIVKWETGALWWKKTYTFDQTYYCGNECGENKN
ncbi:MAG: hypothetical protein IKP12_00370 [Acholeplasmatales bacterium]|nr:hypothetical protein [Acholeplasmatales bacterium]